MTSDKRRTLKEWGCRLRWWLRGVGVEDFRAMCARCGTTGQAHWALRVPRRMRKGKKLCIRFKRRGKE